MQKKWVYLFHEGDRSLLDLLGGKGSGIAEMTRSGVPVPPGFTITTEACLAYYESGKQFPEGMWEQTLQALHAVETQTGKVFGDPHNPLIVSVRSGSKFSMPGMMDTVLNLGLNEATLAGLATLTDNPRFANDAYRRFIQLFGRIVLGVDDHLFSSVIERYTQHGKRSDTDLSTEELRAISDEFKQIVLTATGAPFPDDPHTQLQKAIGAVFSSWFSRRATDYRRLNHISDSLGTAVNVQMMVFGNMGDDCATGVAFTRNPNTGELGIFGEYLINAQGEDVVAGIRTPQPISRLHQDMPDLYDQFKAFTAQLELHYRDMQDIEFTIERGKLYLLQTRSGKRTGPAAVRIAVDLVNEGVIDKATAVRRVDPDLLNQFLFPIVAPDAAEANPPIAKGLAASPGAVSGAIVFDPDEAVQRASQGEQVVLVRVETAPEDFHGMVAALAILTARGGRTSHAAVVARGMGKCCVCGCEDLAINYADESVHAGNITLRKGDMITVDGHNGIVYAGVIPTNDPEVVRVVRGEMAAEDSILYGYFTTFLGWADEFRTINIRANADTPTDAEIARRFGAEGIGLCRTEHMFFEGDRIDEMRHMILADTESERRAALKHIEPLQQSDFEGIFRVMNGFPVTIRTLDPPLHEFLPHTDSEIDELADKLHLTSEHVHQRVDDMQEKNPMLGFRGTRLGVSYPEITETQARALFRAIDVAQREGITVLPEVMIPLVDFPTELKLQADIIRRVAAEVEAETGTSFEYLIGTMIELPRAALIADEIAESADFFSFGTNDLTQTTLGISRDDANFLGTYVDRAIIEDDPFKTIDRKGVGQLLKTGIKLGRGVRPDLKIGVCGEHGGDPQSILFFYDAGVNYVSCSPYRVPIARLAAAQAALRASA
ncbi:MAG: pyruvate, phosphate dikinase [Chloroflexaceae bacterium]|nr:pyruvate, phosphate dikinase [Chloroflexaceae bacterium]